MEERGENQLVFGMEWFHAMEEKVNAYLSENKKRIVRGIFHKDIEIGEFYFHLVNINDFYVWEIEKQEFHETVGKKADLVRNAIKMIAHMFAEDVNANSRKEMGGIFFQYNPDKIVLKEVLAERIWRMILFSENMLHGGLLFLPASRTGLQLLSKYFFAERDRKLVEDISFFDAREEENNEKLDVAENRLGLTMPVYDFLQFLVRYIQRSRQGNRKLLDFIEKHLIDGQVKQMGDEVYYHPDALAENKENIPLYLASSLVNEVTPIIKALSGQYSYRYIFYDEIETCLHPLKQGEMARLIIRLVNSGRRMIVSTHSDTMASKLNNLLLLSFAEDSVETRRKKLEELGLSEDDLLSDAKVHVYQFVNQKDGSSCVEELKFQTMPYIGYDFNLFTRNLDELSYETDIILR